METAVSGSSPALMKCRPGASSATHANFDGGRVEPISTATTRVLMPSDQTPHHPSSQADRRSLLQRHEHAAPRNADATDVRSAAPIRATIVKRAYGSGPVTTRAAGLG